MLMIIYAKYAHDNLDISPQHQEPKMVIIVCIYFDGYHKTDHVNFVQHTADLNVLKNKLISKMHYI